MKTNLDDPLLVARIQARARLMVAGGGRNARLVAGLRLRPRHTAEAIAANLREAARRSGGPGRRITAEEVRAVIRARWPKWAIARGEAL